jgi:pyridinium-3,5-biscarboxylic acid mononucleotide synthase
MASDVNFDFDRRRRIGLGESVLCLGKTPAQIGEAIALAQARQAPVLLTRLQPETFTALAAPAQTALDYDPAVAREALRTLGFYGLPARAIADVGVAGLWRILEYEEELRRYPAVIVVAGMEGALFSVVGGLVGGVVIAVPTSTGYGAARRGETALHAALASCAPGVVTVNIDNGYGAACAAVRVLGAHARPEISASA